MQLISMMHETNEDAGRKGDEKKFHKMVVDASEYIFKSTERLSKLACEREGLPVSEFAKDVVNFYKVLPDDLFMGKPSTFEGIDEEDYYDEI